MSTTARTIPGPDGSTVLHVITIDTPSLGDRSYVVHDGTQAAVVDPQRDLDRLMAVLEEHELSCEAVFETHIHNDYVSGGLELVRRTGASYHVSADDPVRFDRTPTRDGDVVEVGALQVRAVHTPGHTPTHLSYVVSDGESDLATLTGGGLLYGSVGRTDLIGPEMTQELSHLQYRSAHELAGQLKDPVEVLPTHGFGSFCSSGEVTETDTSTIGRERELNDALTAPDEDTFVEELLAGLDAYPRYYARMGPSNLAGPTAVDLSPAPELSAEQLRSELEDGAWVVDLRDHEAYAAAFLPGTVNLPYDDTASTHLAWLMPFGTPLVLVADDAEKVAAMQRQLVRVGIDRVQGWASTEVASSMGETASYPVVDFAGVAELLADNPDDVLLDTRRNLEWADGHVDGAVHVPLHELADRLDELPEGRLVVHCAGGYRAAIGASLLARADRDVVLVADEVDRARDAGLPWVR